MVYFPRYIATVVYGFDAHGASYTSTFIVEKKFKLFSIIYCTVVLVLVVVVVFAVVVGLIVPVGIVPNEYLNKWCIC